MKGMATIWEDTDSRPSAVRLKLADPSHVFRFSIGQTVMDQPKDGWRGVVDIDYREGWLVVDTRYRWTYEERRACAGVIRRIWLSIARSARR
jgi:hypothetical protein